MNNIKIAIAIFSMVLVFSIVSVMLWNKNSEYRIEEMKRMSDYIVESNFKYQRKREEVDFIKTASLLEDKINTKKDYDASNELVDLRSTALSLAAYGSEVNLQQKLNLIDCLKETRDKSSNCSFEYARNQTKKVYLNEIPSKSQW